MSELETPGPINRIPVIVNTRLYYGLVDKNPCKETAIEPSEPSFLCIKMKIPLLLFIIGSLAAHGKILSVEHSCKKQKIHQQHSASENAFEMSFTQCLFLDKTPF